jgi:hypothetical protein
MGLILLVFALVFFILAGLRVPSPPRGDFVAWGLACCVLYVLLGAFPSLLNR